jgi:excisionase family DNA binding protein
VSNFSKSLKSSLARLASSEPFSEAEMTVETTPLRGRRIKQFCEDTGISRPTVYRAIKSGRLRKEKFEGCTIITFEAEAEYLANRKAGRAGKPEAA